VGGSPIEVENLRGEKDFYLKENICDEIRTHGERLSVRINVIKGGGGKPGEKY